MGRLGLVVTEGSCTVKLQVCSRSNFLLALKSIKLIKCHVFRPSKYWALADGFLLVFDLGNKTSFENAKHLHKEVCMALPSKTLLFVLVGNKCDRSERQVNRDTAELLADKIGAAYIEVSAKTGHNVAEIFELLTRRIYQASTRKDDNKCSVS